jgi:hypothetical protein
LAHGVPFKIKAPSILTEQNDRIEIHFLIEKSETNQKLIVDYMEDSKSIGIQSFLRSSKYVKDVLMSAVRSAKRSHLFADGAGRKCNTFGRV